MADWRKSSKSFQRELLSHAKDYNAAAAKVFTNASEDFLHRVNSYGDHVVPIYTGNLIDSIGVRILVGNRLSAFRTMVDTTYEQHAVKPQHMKGVYPIWGEVEIMKRIMRPSRRTGRGVVAQMMVGVPYADEVDKTHDYFDELRELFETEIIYATNAVAIEKALKLKPARMSSLSLF